MTSLTPKRIGNYAELAPLEGVNSCFLGRESRFQSDEIILLKVFPRGADGTFSNARFLEPKLLASVRSPGIPRLGEAGYDPDSDLQYYSMILERSVRWLAWKRLSPSERREAILWMADALSDLHTSGFVYRSFFPSPLAVVDHTAVLYDFSRAARVGPGGFVTGCATLEPFDPPEASREQYEGQVGDVYGLGILCRDIGLQGDDVAGVIATMVSVDPAQRPRSMRDAHGALSRAAGRMSPH